MSSVPHSTPTLALPEPTCGASSSSHPEPLALYTKAGASFQLPPQGREAVRRAPACSLIYHPELCHHDITHPWPVMNEISLERTTRMGVGAPHSGLLGLGARSKVCPDARMGALCVCVLH